MAFDAAGAAGGAAAATRRAAPDVPASAPTGGGPSNVAPAASRGAGPAAANLTAEGAGNGTTTLYRAVSTAEMKDIRDTGIFRAGRGNYEGKLFGLEPDEVLDYATHPGINAEASAIVGATLPSDIVASFDFLDTIDTSIFKSGVISVDRDMMDVLNNSIIGGIFEVSP
jgi:hypothetical protein